jgi:hypothetical protein
MPSRTTDCRFLFGEEHAREILAIRASLRPAAEERAMEALYSRCCGLDVHKSSITACVAVNHCTRPEFPLRLFWGSFENELTVCSVAARVSSRHDGDECEINQRFSEPQGLKAWLHTQFRRPRWSTKPLCPALPREIRSARRDPAKRSRPASRERLTRSCPQRQG